MGEPGADKRNIIVIGASAGGISALIKLVGQLPQDFYAAVFIVLHVSAHNPSKLPQILSRTCKLKIAHASDGEPVVTGRIYIAPPDFHMLLHEGTVVVKKGPKENRFRPSIDALFRSAAYTYGARVIGIVLSGMLDDGTSGMWTIKRLGGICIIQAPEEAIFPSMPDNVSEYVKVDHVLPADKIGEKLQELVKEVVVHHIKLPDHEIIKIKTEIDIATQNNSVLGNIIKMGEPTSLTCPECAGALLRIKDGNLIRYRCNTGHAFTHDALLADASKNMEEVMWKVVRNFEEVMMILEESSRQFDTAGNNAKAVEYRKKADAVKLKVVECKNMIFNLGILIDNNIEPENKTT